MEHNKDKSKKIPAQINEGYNTTAKRDRYETEGISEPSENVIVKKARVEGPNIAMQMNKQQPNLMPVTTVPASAGRSGIMSSIGFSVGTSASTYLTRGSVPSSIPPWDLNLASSGSSANTSADMDMARSGTGLSAGMFVPHMTNMGSGTASRMGRDVPDNLARLGSSTGTGMPENLAYMGRGAGTSVDSIFFISGPEQDCTESIADQTERADNANGVQGIGVSSASAVSASDNTNRPRRLQRTINFRDLQRAMEMDPELAKYDR